MAGTPPTDHQTTVESRSRETTSRSAAAMANIIPELCEFAPLDFLLQQLPRKAQRAQLTIPTTITVEFTCMDVNRDFIVLGANFSMVFVYNRVENTIIKLKCEDRSCRITCVKLLTTLDHQLAVGTSTGQVEVYLIPARRPDPIKEVKKFLVSGGHKVSVTCADWSTNGMKLFTGDSVGNVVYTNIDFYENNCLSTLVLKEEVPIVQLNYGHKTLIISTYHRTVLCYTDDNNRIQQVGQQPRKCNGYFGGHFIPAMCKASDATLFATRPGLRLWHANIEGGVHETLKFRHLFDAPHQTIMLLQSTRTQSQTAADIQFGPVAFFQDNYVLTWSHNLLAVLDVLGPKGARVVASSVCSLGSIISVATHGDEIYVLRRGGDRPLVRIATAPEVVQLKEHIKLPQHLIVPSSSSQGGSSDSNTNSPTTQRKDRSTSSIKHGFTAVRSLLSKAKDELVDTTAKIKVPKFGKQHEEDHSASSSRRGSQDVPPPPDGEVDLEAILSPEINASKWIQRSQDMKPESTPIAAGAAPPAVTGEQAAGIEEGNGGALPCNPPDAAGIDDGGAVAVPLSEAARPVDCPNTDELPTLMLNEQKLDLISNENFDDILFQPAKHSKKKKKKHKTSKKDHLGRSASPSPVPPDGSQNSPYTTAKSSPVSGTDSSSNVMSGTDNSPNVMSGNVRGSQLDGQSYRSNSFGSDNRSVRSESNVSEADLESIGSSLGISERLGDSDRDNVSRSGSINEKDSTCRTESSIPTEIAEPVTILRSTSLRGSPKKREGVVIIVSDRNDNGQQETRPSGEEGTVYQDPGLMPVGGSVSDVATRHSMPASGGGISPYNLQDLPGTLRSWEESMLGSEPMKAKIRQVACTDDIQSLVSDVDNLQFGRGGPIDGRDNQAQSASQLIHHDVDDATKIPLTLTLRKSDSVEDEFYGRYCTVQTPNSDISTPEGFPDDETFDRDPSFGPVDDTAAVERDDDETELEDTPLPENVQQKFAGSWMQCNTPGYVMQLVISDKHIWCVDNRDKVYHSLISNVSLKWSKLKDSAMQIATSPSGNIVWRLHRKTNTAFACAPISPHSPIGTKWYEAARGVTHICLDENVAWLIKTNGDIYVHKGISRDLPYTKSERAQSNAFVVQIVANRGVVWAVASNKKILYRSDIGRSNPEGKKWLNLDDDCCKLCFVSIALDSRGVGWGIDDDGLVWFRTGVTPSSPTGDDKKWWQVPMGEYLMQDPNALKMLINMAGSNATVDRMTNWLKRQYYRATHIAASGTSVWVCGSYHYKSSLHVSKGNLLGSLWESGCPTGLPLSACWVTLSATGVYGPSGMIWAALKSGEVFCFPPDTRKPLQVDPPHAGCTFKHLSATPDTLWALQDNGDIFVRKQISERCPQGLSWKRLSLDQLGHCRIVHFSCGANVVWACDNEGLIYLRIGVDIPHDESLPPAWVLVDGKAVGYGAAFVQVFCSIDNQLVWALDNKRTVYVRRGIGESLPVGLEWEVVEGTLALHLCISSSTVWALCPNGDVACRFGITERNCMGDYWKKVPGSFTYLSVTQSDDIWGLSSDGKLFQRFTKMFHRRGVPQIEQLGTPIAEDDWELL